MTSLFPQGIALDSSFYDRDNERRQLKKNIENTIHTALIAPRRFGKTSLMAQVINENKYPHIWFDFMTITSIEEVQQKLITKIAALITELSPLEHKIKNILGQYFTKLKPEIILSMPGIAIKFHPFAIPQQGIIEALLEFDKFLKESKQRVVIVMDEFQEVIRIEPHDKILQAAIRHAAERSSAITYLFSGSKHRPLRKMFTGKSNPLYELCDMMTLERISKEDYHIFLNKAAQEKWGYPLNEEIIDKILDYTDRYPKYVNALCNHLWSNELEPSIELVEQLWKSYLFTKKTDISDDLSELTLNQKRLLQLLAFEPTQEPYSKDFLMKLNMSQSSTQSVLAVLLDKGIIAKIEGEYRVLDPTIRAYFMMF